MLHTSFLATYKQLTVHAEAAEHMKTVLSPYSFFNSIQLIVLVSLTLDVRNARYLDFFALRSLFLQLILDAFFEHVS